MRKLSFLPGNEIQLLHNGEAYFAALIDAMDQAKQEIYLETYIFAEDQTANKVKFSLQKAAARGVQVYVIIDWLGCGNQQALALVAQLTQAGVGCRCFNPRFKRGLARTHRKIAVIDQQIAFVGGLNIIDDYISDDGSGQILEFPRWDFAVRLRGSLLPQIHQEIEAQWLRAGKLNLTARLQLRFRLQHVQRPIHTVISNFTMQAAFVVRDNLRNRSTIQKAYLQALGSARKRAILANPYFAPGRKLRAALISAAQRGVEVSLLIGVGQFALQDAVTHSFYPKLLQHGVRIIEYRKTQLHAKVAVIDDEWATVGSSNFDGLSLFLNQEANVFIRDQAFCSLLTLHLQQGIREGVVIDPAEFGRQPWYRRLWYGTAYLIYRALMNITTGYT